MTLDQNSDNNIARILRGEKLVDDEYEDEEQLDEEKDADKVKEAQTIASAGFYYRSQDQQ